MLLAPSVVSRSGRTALKTIRPPLVLEEVDGFTTSSHGQVIRGLDIWCDNNPLVIEHRVKFEWCRVWHRNGQGIVLQSGGSNSVFTDFMVTHVDPPAGSAGHPEILSGAGQNNIEVYNATNVIFKRMMLSHGASGLYVQGSQRVRARWVVGGPFHGPFPRGQLFQTNDSVDCSMLDFVNINDVDESHPEDCFNFFESVRSTLGRGLIVGCNAPNGTAVMFEDSTGKCFDVDALEMWNGAFSAFYAGAAGVLFDRVRTKNNYAPGANPGGRTGSTSNGATFVAAEGASPSITRGKYANVSNPTNVRVEYNGGAFSVYDVAAEDFTPRSPIVINFPDWPEYEVPPIPEPEGVIHEGVMTGASAGSPGSLPTGWANTGTTATYSVANGVQVIDNVECIDVSISGGFLQLFIPTGYGGVTAVAGEQYVIDTYVKPVAGTMTGLGVSLYEIDASYGYLTEHMISPSIPSASNFSDCLIRHKIVFTNASTARTNGYLYLEASSSATVRLSSRIYRKWFAGPTTTLTVSGGRARATRTTAGNPRVVRQFTGLTPGSSYNVTTNLHSGTQSGSLYLRVHSGPALGASGGDTYGEIILGGSGSASVDFTAPSGGTVYVGLIAICSANGQYAEIDEDFVITPN